MTQEPTASAGGALVGPGGTLSLHHGEWEPLGPPTAGRGGGPREASPATTTNPRIRYWRTGDISRFPLYDNIGTARGLVDASGTVTDNYVLDTFGRYVSGAGSTANPYKYGGAWGYITDPSGMLQLGHRFYWPEVGRFVGQDPIGDGVNWYAYVGGDPSVAVDPPGLGAGTTVMRRRRAPGGGAVAGGNRAGPSVPGSRSCRRHPPCPPEAKPKPARSPECQQCDSQYLNGFKAIWDGITNPGANAARSGAGAAVTAGSGGRTSCGTLVGAGLTVLQITNTAVALALNEKAYLDCCKKYDCVVLTIPQLVPGAAR